MRERERERETIVLVVWWLRPEVYRKRESGEERVVGRERERV